VIEHAAFDIPFGRVFKITPAREWELVVQYDGWPNGLKFHRDGRIVMAYYRRGLMILDPGPGTVRPLLETAYSEVSRGAERSALRVHGDL
jgi:gluconolactonase